VVFQFPGKNEFTSPNLNKKQEIPLNTDDYKDEDIDLMNLLNKFDSEDEKGKPLKAISNKTNNDQKM